MTLPLLLLLRKLPKGERAELLAEIREGRKPQFERRRAQMDEHGVFADVVGNIQTELAAAAALLAPWSRLEPASLLGRLVEMLRQQVDSLKRDAVS